VIHPTGRGSHTEPRCTEPADPARVPVSKYAACHLCSTWRRVHEQQGATSRSTAASARRQVGPAPAVCRVARGDEPAVGFRRTDLAHARSRARHASATVAYSLPPVLVIGPPSRAVRAQRQRRNSVPADCLGFRNGTRSETSNRWMQSRARPPTCKTVHTGQGSRETGQPEFGAAVLGVTRPELLRDAMTSSPLPGQIVVRQ